MNDNIIQIQKRIKDMPSISGNTLKILDLITEDDYNIKDLAQLVSYDVSLATRCLKIVNSAHFGLRSQITSIDRAVSYLGKQAIFGLVIESGFDFVYAAPLKGYNEVEGGLWDHSLRTAIASRLLAIETGHKDISDISYTAGLLHNMGKVIIADFLINQKEYLIERIKKEGDLDFSVLEKDVLKVDHSEVGEMMADNWGLPDALKTVILFHHNPSDAPEEHKEICYLVHIGDHMAMLSGGSTGYDSLSYTMDPKATEYIKINEDKMDMVMIDVELEFVEAKEKILA